MTSHSARSIGGHHHSHTKVVAAQRALCVAGPATQVVAARRVEGEGGVDVSRMARLYGAALYRRAVRLCGDPAEAWDVLQDVYERALRLGPARLSDPQALAWLHTVMRNLALDRMRARNRHPTVELERPESVPSPEDGDVPEWSSLTLEEVRACVARLTEPLRSVYELHALEGLSYSEISARLQVPANTVGTRLMRARQKLRQALAAREATAAM
jgi:RNA polymerase sigma-70 factor, ECF subfamily